MTTDTRKRKTAAKDDAERGDTKVAQDGEPAPRLPHERDQSSSSQQNQDGSAPEVGRQALEDIERGAVDTGTGPVTDRTYNDKVKR